MAGPLFRYRIGRRYQDSAVRPRTTRIDPIIIGLPKPIEIWMTEGYRSTGHRSYTPDPNGTSQVPHALIGALSAPIEQRSIDTQDGRLPTNPGGALQWIPEHPPGRA